MWDGDWCHGPVNKTTKKFLCVAQIGCIRDSHAPHPADCDDELECGGEREREAGAEEGRVRENRISESTQIDWKRSWLDDRDRD